MKVRRDCRIEKILQSFFMVSVTNGSSIKVINQQTQIKVLGPGASVGGGAEELNDLSDVNTEGGPIGTSDLTMEVLAKQSPFDSDEYTPFLWTVTGGGSGGEANDGRNIGTGLGIFAGKNVTPLLDFYSIGTTSEISPTISNDTFLFTIQDNSIANSKLSTFPANRILGRITTSGDAQYLTDSQVQSLLGVQAGAEPNQSDAEIKIQYENNPDTNAFTDSEKANLANQSGTNTGDNVQATETVLGIAEIAELIEVNDGTDDKTIITPLKLEQSDLRAEVTVNTGKISADGSVTTHNDVTDAGSGAIITAAERLDISTNNAKVTNATHTGHIAGSGDTTLQGAAISDQLAKATPIGTDSLLITDSEDSNNLKRITIANLPSGGGGAGELNDLSDVESAPLGSSTLGTLRVLADITNPSNGTPTGIFKVIDWSPPTAGGGEVNDGTNLGTGAQLYEGKSGSTLRFRTLVASTWVQPIQNTNDITFDIIANSITVNELQTIPQDRILGRIDVGTGTIQTLTDTQVLSIIGVEAGAEVNPASTDELPDTATNRYTNDTDISRLANTSGINTGDETTATQAVEGIAEIATVAEINSGTLDDKIISPLGLQSSQLRSEVTVNTAKVSADGSVTTHNDVIDAGSGEIITSIERSNIGDRTTHTGESTYNDENIIFERGGTEVGRSGSLTSEDGVFLAATNDGLFDSDDGGIAAKLGVLELYGSGVYVISEGNSTDFRQALFSPDGQLFSAPLPEPGWEVSDTDTADYDLGTGTGAGAWIQLTTLTVQFPQDANIGDTINVDYSVYTVNKTVNRTGNLEIAFNSDSGTPVPPTIVDDFTFIGAGFAGYVSGRIAVILANPVAQNDFVRIWARINNGNNAQYGLDLLGSTSPHSLLVSTPGSGGTGATELNELNDVNTDTSFSSTLTTLRILADVTNGNDNTITGIYKPVDLTITGGGGGGDVFKVGTPVNNQIGVWTGDGTIEGTNELTFTGSLFSVGSATAIRAIALNGTSVISDALGLGSISLDNIDELDATTQSTINSIIDITASQVSDFDTEVSNNASVVANTAKVSADGSVTTHNDVTNAGSGAIITASERSDISTNNAKVTNATHTGHIAGSGDTTLQGAAISDQALTTAASGDQILLERAGTLFKADFDDFGGGTPSDINDIPGTLNLNKGGTGATDAATARTNLGAASQTDLDNLKIEVITIANFSLDGDINIDLDLAAEYQYTVESVTLVTSGGSFTATFRIGLTNIPGLVGLTVNTGISTDNATGTNNTVNPGDRFQLVATGLSAVSDFSGTIRLLRS